MASAQGIIIELHSAVGGLGGILSCQLQIQPHPGQYLLASSEDPNQLLPCVLFPSSLPGDHITLAPPLPTSWLPGTQLILRGPLGHGFDLPRGAQRLALAAFHTPPALLSPLAQLAVSRGANVAFYTDQPPPGLPVDIEVLPLELLSEALAWADALAAALAPTDLEAFRRACGLAVHRHFHIPAQALLLTPMPCSSLADCGICSVSTSRGPRLACKQGPVFDLDDLELV